MCSTPQLQPTNPTVHAQVAPDGRLQLHSIQYLRAIAATAVVFAHSSTALFDNMRTVIPFDHIGSKGVDLFFVISGFLMFFTTDQRRISPAEFFRKRIIRIFPLYLILSTFG